MKSFLARWRPWHVITAWCVYWVGLAGVTLTPTILAILHASGLPKDAATVNASFNNSLLSISVSEFGKTTHLATATALEIALWIGLPPLALYALWMVTRSRRVPPAPAALGDSPLDTLPRSDLGERASSSSIHSRAPHA
ncbi:MAG TPA: hypothetical protein VJO52_11915 [Gemmatimonadaceae bacterium]|nr:hypothetical protein [Gemmatimonadaceae bacterium]